MRSSRYFLPVLKEAPSDAQIVSHQLMLRAGMIRQEAAGIYAWLRGGTTPEAWRTTLRPDFLWEPVPGCGCRGAGWTTRPQRRG